jgi:hypothetical protein
MSMTPLARAVALAAISAGTILPNLAHADFIKDSKGSLELRNFYFNRDARTENAPQNKFEEWAQGFLLRMESGYTEGTVGFGVDALGLAGLKLDSSQAKAGTGLLPRGADGAPDSYGSLGLTGKIKVSKSVLKFGTLGTRVPVLQANDTRLLPQTFEGAQITVQEIKDLNLTAGHLRQIKDRNSTDYTDFTITTNAGRNIVKSAGGALNKGDDFNFAGADYKFTDTLTGSYYYGNLADYYKQHFFGLVHTLPIAKGQSLKTDLRYFSTSEDGHRQVQDIDNRALMGMLTYSLGGHAFGLGYQQMNGNTGFAFLNTVTDPYLVNYVQIGNFSSAKEKSWQARYDYNFASIGLPGLTFMTRYVYGDNIELGGTRAEGKEWERNMDLGYVIQSGPVKGLGLKWRNATYRSNLGNNGSRPNWDENRLILSYTLPLF